MSLALVSMHSYTRLGVLLRRVLQLYALALLPMHNQEPIFLGLTTAKGDVPYLAALAL